jgi:hypothetical protein
MENKMGKVIAGFVAGVLLVVPQTRSEIVQIAGNIVDMTVGLIQYGINLI